LRHTFDLRCAIVNKLEAGQLVLIKRTKVRL